MSLTPESAVAQTVSDAVASPPKRKSGAPLLIFALLTLAIGGCLVVLPWVDSWNLNYIQDLIPGAQQLWDEPSFRGAITGLGFVNLYIAVLQFARLRRRKY